MRRQKIFLLHFLLVISLVCAFGGGAPAFAAERPAQGLAGLEEIFRDVQLLHISGPDGQTLIEGAIDGLLDTLNDPYTVYLTPEELRELRNTIEGSYVGVGVQVQPGKIYPLILNTIENTPASRAGIRAGDMIIKIDGCDISYKPLGEVVENIRGPAGTKLTMTLRREGAADFDIQLERAAITSPTVSGRILDGGVGYIYIGAFGDSTGDEFRKILDGLTEQGAAGLILDLRDNPGGIIHSALAVGSNFIEPGRVVASTCDGAGSREEYLAERDTDVVKGMPIMALVNEYSASAAELLAGALQDYGLATLIGGKTYGKGTVQAVVPLETGGALKITVARYLTPKERVIDGTGLVPDVQVLTPGLSLAVAYAYLNGDPGDTISFDRDKDEATINGIVIGNSRAPQLSGRTYLPLRLLLEWLGYRVDWLPGEGAVRAVMPPSEAFFYPAEGRCIINGQAYAGVDSPLSFGGSVYMPESLLPFFNAFVRYEGNAVIIEKKS